jgi:protein-disulfide isomerase
MKTQARFRTVALHLAVTLLVVASFSTGAGAEGLTAQQGDAILNELRQIKQLLERQQRPAQPPQPQAPPTERVKVKLPSTLYLGKADAPVTLVEVTDYQCPYCNRFDRDTLPELVKKYVDTGKVKLIPLDFPLDFHKNAMKAAMATRCAADQGKFWQMREALLKEPKAVEGGNFAAMAKEVGLDDTQFQACMDGQKHAGAIKAMMDAARSAGISGTPSFIIAPSGETLDGVKIVGALPLTVFEEKIREALPPGKR